MAFSMTGYGSAALNKDSWSLTWEIKSVNSRHLDLKWKTPPSLNFIQGEWEKLVRHYASRGRVEIYLDMRILDPGILNMELDRTMAQAMLEDIRGFSREIGADFTPDLNIFLKIPSLWKEQNTRPRQEFLDDLEGTLNEALRNWNRSREAEGDVLVQDLQNRLGEMENLLTELKGLAKDNAGQRFQELKQRVDKILSEMDWEPDENRLLQELGLLSEKLDVTEELTRMGSHLEAMRNLLKESREVGRKLDFLLQEAFREINTCANKCQNTDMSRFAVEFKAQLEKCREQAQNLE